MTKRLVHGVGNNDVPGSWGKHYYIVWKHMLDRCVNSDKKKQYVTYQNVTFVPEWKDLSNFKAWYDTQGNVKGMHLDKDIKFPGNKVYGPDTCMFVTKELNLFFTLRQNHRGQYPLGVTYNKKHKKYYAQIKVGGSRLVQYLGTYDTPEKAYSVYSDRKKEEFDRRFLQPETNPVMKSILLNVYNNFEEYLNR